MKKNIGKLDKILRTLTAIALVLIYFIAPVSGKTAVLLLTLACLFFVTSLFSFCPLYYPFGVSTRKNSNS